MAVSQKIRFQLTAYDPNPSDVTLALAGEECILEECKGSNISIERYMFVLSYLLIALLGRLSHYKIFSIYDATKQ